VPQPQLPLLTGVVYATGNDTALGEIAGLSRGVRKVTGCQRRREISALGRRDHFMYESEILLKPRAGLAAGR
jgi:hypothetical protein